MAAKSKSRSRSRVVPNWNYDHQRTSSSMGRTPFHFFKIILPSTLHDMKLRIPEKFVKQFGDALSTIVTLSVPNGDIWQVGLEKSDKNIWFCDGWPDFVEYHSICYGYFFVFGYEGNSNFHVYIFDKTATEIQYPSSKNCRLENLVDIIELDDSHDSDISGHNKLNENEMSNSDELSTKHEVREKFVRKKFSGMSSKGKFIMPRGREKAIQAAKKFKPKNASFMGILQPYNIHYSYMYVPAEFSINHISRNHNVTLQTSNGKQWHIRCQYHQYSASSAMKMSKGCAAFFKDNNLEEGDVCVFEVIKRKPVVLSVSIFHVVDHQSSD